MNIDEMLAGLEVGVEPPAREAVSDKYAPVIAAIRAAKDTNGDPTWVKLPGNDWNNGWASRWNTGKIGGIEAGEFEAIHRNTRLVEDVKRNPDGSVFLDDAGEAVTIRKRVGDLYIRYVGLEGIAERAAKLEMSEAELNSLTDFIDKESSL